MDRIDQMEPGQMLLSEKDFATLRGAKKLMGRFLLRNELREGRECSQRKIPFGEIVISSERDQPMGSFIAAKPFSTEYDLQGRSPAEALAHEWVMSSVYSKRFGYNATFLPLGLWKVERADKPRLLTGYQRDVRTLDRVLWADFESAINISDEMILKGLAVHVASVGTQLGYGLSDGDPQPKNVARCFKRPFYPDREYSSVLAQKGTLIPATTANKEAVGHNLRVMAMSTIDTRQTENVIMERILSFLMEPKVTDGLQRTYKNALKTASDNSGLEIPRGLTQAQGYFTSELFPLAVAQQLLHNQ